MMRGALVLLLAGTALATELNTKALHDEALGSGKNVLIKYQAPWWGHCKRMKPDFDKVMAEYESSSSVIIADVDCTDESGGKAVCDSSGVSGFPTIKYFKDGSTTGTDYSGGRDYDGIVKFIKEELERPCTTDDPKECTDKEKAFIEKMKGKGAEDVKKQLDRLEGMKGKSMKADLKQWWAQRVNILKQLAK